MRHNVSVSHQSPVSYRYAIKRYLCSRNKSNVSVNTSLLKAARSGRRWRAIPIKGKGSKSGKRFAEYGMAGGHNNITVGILGSNWTLVTGLPFDIDLSSIHIRM